MSLLVRLSTDPGALLVRDTDDPLALAVTESTSPLALRVQESTSPLAQRVRGLFSPSQLPGLAAWYDAADSSTVLTQVGGATNFVAASSQFLECPHNASLQMGDIDFTISMWVNDDTIAASNYEYYLSKGNPNAVGGEYAILGGLGTGSGPTGFRVRDAANTAISAAVTSPTCSVQQGSGQWSHLVAWHDSIANTLNIQLNGGTISTQSLSSGVFAGTGPFRVAAGPSGNFSNSAIDELCIFKRVLTADERTFLFNSGAGRTYAEAPDSLKTNLVSWWSMNAPATGDWLDQHGTNHLTPSASRPTATTGVTFNVAQDGQTVRRWLDKSGNNRHLNQADLVNQMRFVASGQNGRGMLDTNSAVGPFMETAAFTALALPLTIYLLASRGTTANSTLFGQDTSTTRFRFEGGSPESFFVLANGATLNLQPPSSAAWVNLRGMHLGIFNGASSRFEMRMPSYQNFATGNTGTNTPTKFQIGGFTGGFTRCEFLEALVYQAAHTTAESQRVAQYFANRWALSHVATAP
jgi:hypothetical protein